MGLIDRYGSIDNDIQASLRMAVTSGQTKTIGDLAPTLMTYKGLTARGLLLVVRSGAVSWTCGPTPADATHGVRAEAGASWTVMGQGNIARFSVYADGGDAVLDLELSY